MVVTHITIFFRIAAVYADGCVAVSITEDLKRPLTEDTSCSFIINVRNTFIMLKRNV